MLVIFKRFLGVIICGTEFINESPSSFLHLFTGSKDVSITDPTPTNQAEECSPKLNEDHLSHNLPETEILRDYVQPQPFEQENLPVWPDLDNNIVEHHEPFSPTINFKESHSPTTKELSFSGVGSLPSQSHSIPVTAGSIEKLGVFDSQVPSGLFLASFLYNF